MEDIIVPIVGGLLVLIILFLVLREFNCWYWKQNEIVGLLRELRDSRSDTTDS